MEPRMRNDSVWHQREAPKMNEYPCDETLTEGASGTIHQISGQRSKTVAEVRSGQEGRELGQGARQQQRSGQETREQQKSGHGTGQQHKSGQGGGGASDGLIFSASYRLVQLASPNPSGPLLIPGKALRGLEGQGGVTMVKFSPVSSPDVKLNNHGEGENMIVTLNS
ncbi:hypothetical protein Pmani_005311 [Petrolisthes manimaculis]|uniref:Uncharacterized protein n=1 Tax=Petrolisthes manimaculis TaxID=1843537 RepID=A0AAE1QCQ6_9EUCA|nr:hypothetical protein Pmani_005311 [Petrolisthes manimaculis]